MKRQDKLFRILLMALMTIGMLLAPVSRTVKAEGENIITDITINVTAPKVGDSTRTVTVSVPEGAHYQVDGAPDWRDHKNGNNPFDHDTFSEEDIGKEAYTYIQLKAEEGYIFTNEANVKVEGAIDISYPEYSPEDHSWIGYGVVFNITEKPVPVFTSSYKVNNGIIEVDDNALTEYTYSTDADGDVYVGNMTPNEGYKDHPNVTYNGKTLAVSEGSISGVVLDGNEWNIEFRGGPPRYFRMIGYDLISNFEWIVTYQPIEYKIAFDANGGEGSMAAVNAVFDQETKLPASTLTKSDMSFDSWNTKSDGSGDSYADQATVKNLAITDGATVTLFAVWVEKTEPTPTPDPTPITPYKIPTTGVE